MKTYNRTNKLITPPPAYFFLPFYVDQDSGWKKNWSSFAYLTQLKRNWKRDIAYFHTGIKPNEFYEIKSKIEMYNKENNELKSERIMRSEERRVGKEWRYRGAQNNRKKKAEAR